MPYRLNTPFMADNPRITIIGCGGTGGFVAEALCRLYTGRQAEIVLVDHGPGGTPQPATAELPTPGRGKAQKRDLGQAVVRVLRTSSGIHRQTLPERGKPDLPGIGRYKPGLMIGCVDNARARREMEECLGSKPFLWLIDAGNGKNWGQVLIGNRPKESQDYKDAFKEDICHELSSPAAQRPDLLTTAPEGPPDIDCAAALTCWTRTPPSTR